MEVRDQKATSSIASMLQATRTVPAGRLQAEPGVFLAPGDPVIILKNQPIKPGRRLVCNGDVGTLRSFAASHALVDFGDTTEKIAFKAGHAGSHLTLAYALTVHKSQGGEFDAVALLVRDGWDRKLLYTALTRAKSRVYVFADPGELRAAVTRTPATRVTVLGHLLGKNRM